MKRKIFLLCISLCAGLLFSNRPVQATEITDEIVEETQTQGEMKPYFYGNTVRVGWFDCEGYFEKDKDGKLVGFGVDYLNAIAAYTGWDYEFVKTTREGCLEKLQAGEVDLISPVCEDIELKNSKVSDGVIGESYGYIYKLGNNFKVSYEEYSKFRLMTIGIEKGSHMEEEVQAYCEKNGFEFYELVFFNTFDEMKSALASRKIDAIVTDSYVSVENLKVIGRFSNGRVAFAASNQVVWEQLNYAMERIKLDNSTYTEDLRKRYFSESSQNNMEYSLVEREFLSVGRKYRVALSTEQYPISYKTTEKVGRKGIAVDILKKMEYFSGITFDIVYVDSYEKGKEMLAKGEVDILGGSIISKQYISNTIFDNVEESTSRRNEYTAPFYDMEMAFIGPKGTQTENYLRIGVPVYMEKCVEELETMYPKYSFVLYRNDEQCLEAILNGEVNAAVQSHLKINELIIYDKYKELQNLKYIPGKYSVAFTIWTGEPVLVNIMNKTVKSISDTSLSTIENNNIQHIAMKQMTPLEFINQYKGYIGISIIMLMALNAAWLGYRKYKEEEKNKEKAYRDSVAKIGSMEKFRVDIDPILKSNYKINYYIVAVDIDKFKLINDLYGYAEGDKVIAYLAKVLVENAGSDSFVGRLNADSFVVLKKAEQFSVVEAYLSKVFETVDKDMVSRDSDYRLIIKAGIYKVSEDDVSLSSMIDKATLAKENMIVGHQNCYALYSEQMRQKAIEDKKMENDMEIALEREEFKVFLQPQIDLKTKKIVSAEALVRWVHPEKGMIPPFKFIPVFEKNGFICKLDYFVWEKSIKTLAKWREKNQMMVPISINLSRVDVEKAGMIESVISLLDKYSIQPKWIKAELTESVCLENDAIIMDKMNMLKEAGLKIAIDDFGSGYSSLHLLKRMPIDILKIDKSFLDYDENMQEKDEIVIRDVVELGKHLQMQIVMEGVETLEQSIFLEGIGCDIAQGYYYGRPMPIEEFEQQLKCNYEVDE